MTCADEVFGSSEAVGRPHLRRAGDGQDSSTSYQPGRSCAGVVAEYVEDEVDSADVYQCVVVEVDGLVRAEVECSLSVGGASGADDVRTGLACELSRYRSDRAGRALPGRSGYWSDSPAFQSRGPAADGPDDGQAPRQ